jgi:hypothetical protein
LVTHGRECKFQSLAHDGFLKVDFCRASRRRLRAKRSQCDLSDDGWSTSRLLPSESGTLVPPFVLLFGTIGIALGAFGKKRIQSVSRTAIKATKCDRATTCLRPNHRPIS